MCVSFFLASQRPKVLPSRFGLFWRMTKIEDMHRFQVNRCCSIICSRWLPNKFTLGSMGLVYLDTWMVDIYGECRQYRSPIDPSWVYPWNLEKIRLFRFQFELMHIFLVRKFRTNYKCFLHQELSKQLSFQIIANPHDLTPKGSWGRGAPRHIGWWNIIYLCRYWMWRCWFLFNHTRCFWSIILIVLINSDFFWRAQPNNQATKVQKWKHAFLNKTNLWRSSIFKKSWAKFLVMSYDLSLSL